MSKTEEFLQKGFRSLKKEGVRVLPKSALRSASFESAKRFTSGEIFNAISHTDMRTTFRTKAPKHGIKMGNANRFREGR